MIISKIEVLDAIGSRPLINCVPDKKDTMQFDVSDLRHSALGYIETGPSYILKMKEDLEDIIHEIVGNATMAIVEQIYTSEVITGNVGEEYYEEYVKAIELINKLYTEIYQQDDLIGSLLIRELSLIDTLHQVV